ncbi:DUF3021 domain-containing protein [Ruminococcaceae bacterium OttesenSCG-928-A16]|nr:DUF3021 domain-containing protein [Ruminococcaceae bacterium OttesenSCG-928-A16]
MTIKKRLVLYGLAGFVGGPFISTIILLIISYANANQWGWVFSPVPPTLTAAIGNHLNAYLVQFLLSGILGAGFAMASLIWQVERWSHTKQTLLHFIASVIVMFPIAYFAGWMEHSIRGFVGYFLIFIAIYAIIWVFTTIGMRQKIKKMNHQLQNKP